MPLKRLAIFGVFLVFLCMSCSGGGFSLKDGYYTAELAEFDEYGWKEYLTIRVSAGKIIHVEYNAFNPSGFMKSWDMDYMRVMNAVNGTYPNAYTRLYGGQLLEKQNAEDIDCISGATHSYQTFLKLAQAVLNNARIGRNGTALVKVSETTEYAETANMNSEATR